jgi:hypothetical protein
MVKRGEAPIDSLYARKLQKKLVFEFKKKFYDKIGYYPIVITNRSGDAIEEDEDGNEVIPFMSLDKLIKHFEEFLPIIDGKKYSLLSKRRFKELVKIRHMYCFIAKTMGYSLKSVGYSLGKVDHTTVIHALRTFSDRYETEPIYRSEYHTIFEKIKEKHKINITNELPTMECGNTTSSDPQPTVFPRML